MIKVPHVRFHVKFETGIVDVKIIQYTVIILYKSLYESFIDINFLIIERKYNIFSSVDSIFIYR